jgi:hypothetical protein
LFARLVLFRLVAPTLQPGVVRPSLGMGCMLPQPFAAGGNRPYPEFWAVAGGPQYLGYFTPIILLIKIKDPFGTASLHKTQLSFTNFIMK